MTLGDLAAFSIRQASALAVCDSARSALVDIIDGVNAKPRSGWRPFTHRTAN